MYNTVRIQRGNDKIEQRRLLWWQYVGRQEKLYEAIREFERILVCGQVSKFWSVSWVDKNHVFADKVVVFALNRASAFAILSSCFHTEWAEKTSSRLKEDPNYSLADTFETLPFPKEFGSETQSSNKRVPDLDALDRVGEAYYKHRRQIMLARLEGLTKTYNRFHDPKEVSADIAELRRLTSKWIRRSLRPTAGLTST